MLLCLVINRYLNFTYIAKNYENIIQQFFSDIVRKSSHIDCVLFAPHYLLKLNFLIFPSIRLKLLFVNTSPLLQFKQIKFKRNVINTSKLRDNWQRDTIGRILNSLPCF